MSGSIICFLVLWDWLDMALRITGGCSTLGTAGHAKPMPPHDARDAIPTRRPSIALLYPSPLSATGIDPNPPCRFLCCADFTTSFIAKGAYLQFLQPCNRMIGTGLWMLHSFSLKMAGAEQMTLYFEPIDDDNENPPSPPPTDMPASSAAAKPTDTSSQPTDKSIVAVGLGGADVQTSRAPAGLAWEHCLLRNPPTARAGHSLCTVECGKTGACGVVLFGGATRTARFFNDAHVLDKGSTQWTQLRLKVQYTRRGWWWW